MMQNTVLVLAAVGLLVSGCGTREASDRAETGSTAVAMADDPTPVADSLVVYKSASCGCCKAWIEHMEKNGFKVVAHDLNAVELNERKQQQGITPELTSCHTALIGGYTIEGHVPADLVKRLLRQRPDLAGLSAPGMPAGSPGMETGTQERYDIIAYKRDGSKQVYATRGGE